MPPSHPAKRAAVFLDRDGVLNEEVDYLHRVEDFAWVPGAPEAVRRLNDAGLLAIVVTNQAGVARGYYDEAAVGRLHEHMQAELQRHGARIDAYYYSPYHPEAADPAYRRDSTCRKPGTGMFDEAVAAWEIDAASSYVVGDKNSDVDAGLALGMTTFLVQTGHGPDHRAATRAHYVVADVGAAVERILTLTAHPAR